MIFDEIKWKKGKTSRADNIVSSVIGVVNVDRDKIVLLNCLRKAIAFSRTCSSAFQFEEAERQPFIRTLSAQEVEPRMKLYGIIQSDSQQSLRFSRSFARIDANVVDQEHDNHRMDFCCFFFVFSNGKLWARARAQTYFHRSEYNSPIIRGFVFARQKPHLHVISEARVLTAKHVPLSTAVDSTTVIWENEIAAACGHCNCDVHTRVPSVHTAYTIQCTYCC